ncbi:DNA-methyltransferase [Helicobacter cetorum]|nr:site-specific DNA-methyltransferase [Helicobacter cetorum]
MNINQVFYHSSTSMHEVSDNSVDLIITSPPYFNIKDYSKNGTQDRQHSLRDKQDLGALEKYEDYILGLLKVWRECYRVLKANGKLCINVPLMPMLKKDLNTHYNRHIFDLHADIEHSILYDLNNSLTENKPKIFLLDVYIWKRTNPTKKLMFGSYPYPRNFYAQNTIEFIGVFVKDGKPKQATKEQKEQSKLSQEEWVELTKQIWEIPIPNKNDIAFGKHSALMPSELAKRLIRLYSCVGDVVLDPFTGSGTTLREAKLLKRNFMGYELYENYKPLIEQKLREPNTLDFK